MAKTVAVINQKGGVGKSSTVQSLSAGLTLKGYKTLVVDLDSQGNTTYSLGAEKEGTTALGLLLGEARAADAIQHTPYGDVIAANLRMAGADMLLTDTGKEYRLREALEPVKSEYDYILIDTPPTLGILTINALTASDSIIIPVQPDLYSLQGIADLMETLRPVKKYCNPSLSIEGILFTRYDNRLSAFNGEISEYAGAIAKNLNTKVFSAVIREAVAVKKAQATQKSIYDYAPRAKVTADYMALVEELTGERNNGE